MADIYISTRAPIEEFTNLFVSSNYKKGYDDRYWMRFMVSVLDILWANKQHSRAYYLNSLCSRFLSAPSREVQGVFVDEIYDKYKDLCLMAEYIANNKKE
jgi:hypothetical protein